MLNIKWAQPIATLSADYLNFPEIVIDLFLDKGIFMS